MKKEDLAFETSFELVANHTETVHALIAHFDVRFDFAPKPFGFSTSARAEYTHWKQTVFYLDTPLLMETGDKLGVRCVCKPNAKNNRDLDITIDYTAPNGTKWSQDYRLR